MEEKIGSNLYSTAVQCRTFMVGTNHCRQPSVDLGLVWCPQVFVRLFLHRAMVSYEGVDSN